MHAKIKMIMMAHDETMQSPLKRVIQLRFENVMIITP